MNDSDLVEDFDLDRIENFEQLRREFARLANRVNTLEQAVEYLVHCKVTDPEMAFFNWMVANRVFRDRRLRLELVLSALDDRLHGRPFRFKKSVSGIPDEKLYADAPPNHEEALQLLMQTLDVKHPQVIEEMFRAQASQGALERLVAWWSERDEGLLVTSQ